MRKSLENRINGLKSKLYEEYPSIPQGCISATFDYEFARQHKHNGKLPLDIPKITYEAVHKHYERANKIKNESL